MHKIAAIVIFFEAIMKAKILCFALLLNYQSLYATVQEFGKAPLVSSDFVSYLQNRSDLAYKPVRELQENRDISLFFNDMTEKTDKTFVGFIEKRERSVIVSFPGTRKGTPFFWSDVGKDIFIFYSDGGYSESLRESEKIGVHPRFAWDVQNSFEEMSNLIGDITGKEIFFTGHSKGAGTATLAAWKYAKTNASILKQSQLKVFTFSSPPVLDHNALAPYHRLIGELNHINIYNNWDPFPYLPLQIKFYHAGIQANIKAKGHGLATFSNERIRELMKRIETNYRINPFMSRFEMGRP